MRRARDIRDNSPGSRQPQGVEQKLALQPRQRRKVVRLSPPARLGPPAQCTQTGARRVDEHPVERSTLKLTAVFVHHPHGQATRRVLDGAFGAAELAPWRWLRAQIEYDTEKWNAGLGLSPWAGLRLRAALLNAESLSLGAGWSLTL